MNSVLTLTSNNQHQIRDRIILLKNCIKTAHNKMENYSNTIGTAWTIIILQVDISTITHSIEIVDDTWLLEFGNANLTASSATK